MNFVKSLLQSLSPKRKTEVPSAGAAFAAMPRLGHAAVVGVSGSGKSTYLDEMAGSLTGCRVLVQLLEGSTPPGWDEAPFWGTFTPASGLDANGMRLPVVTEDWELDEILRLRPAGLFRLEIPASRMSQVGSALSAVLNTGARKGPTDIPLTIVVDEAEALADQALLAPVLQEGRKLNVSLALAVQRASSLEATTRGNLAHVSVLIASPMDFDVLRGQLQLQPADLSDLRNTPLGEVTCFSLADPLRSSSVRRSFQLRS